MKKNLTEVTQQKFESALAALQAANPQKISGPFVNSAPAGSMFTEPQRESAWVIGSKTVLLKHENLPSGAVLYCADPSILP